MKKEDRHPIDDFFRDQLEGSEQAPPKWSWERLEQSLDSKRKRKLILWWQMAAASVLLLIAFSAGYYLSGGDMRGPGSTSHGTLNAPAVSMAPQENAAEQENASSSDYNNSNQSTNKPANNQEKSIHNALKEDVNSPALPDQQYAASQSNITSRQNYQTKAGNSPLNPDESIQSQHYRSSIHTLHLVHLAEISLDKKLYQPAYRTEHIDHWLNPFWFEESTAGINTEADNNLLIGANVAPMLAYRSTSSMYNSDQEIITPTTSTDTEVHSYSEQPLPSFSAGISTSLELGKGYALATGIQFTRLGQQSENLNIPINNTGFGEEPHSLLAITSAGEIEISEDEINSLDIQGSFANANALESNKLTQQFEYLEVPLMLEKDIIDKALKLSLDAGFSAGLLIGNRAFFEENGQRHELGQTNDIRKLLWSGRAGLGLSIPLAEAWELSLNPGFRYAITSINKDSDYIFRPWSISFGTGLTYKLY